MTDYSAYSAAIDVLTYIGTLIAVVAVIGIFFRMGPAVARGVPRAVLAPNSDSQRLWNRHLDALADLEIQYVAFETDPWSAFRRPLLGDVSQPETAHFHKALRRAQDLRTDEPPASRLSIDEFGAAVHDAQLAWQIADRHARAIAVPTTTADERRRLRQAEDALRLALDERTPPAERRVALDRVEHLIKGITTIEPAAKTVIVAELDHIERREITP